MREVSIFDLDINPIKTIGQEWMLLTAGNEENGYNTMTISWGHMGAMWGLAERKLNMGLPTVVVYARPKRYTKEFVDREGFFTLSVFDDTYKKALGYLGSHSGRDEDKVAKVGLTPMFTDGTTCFEEAKMVLVCRKLYHAPLLENGFVDADIVKENYPEKDFHEMYVGEIVKVLVKE